MNCSFCGKEIKAGAKFCAFCGTRAPSEQPRNIAEGYVPPVRQEPETVAPASVENNYVDEAAFSEKQMPLSEEKADVSKASDLQQPKRLLHSMETIHLTFWKIILNGLRIFQEFLLARQERLEKPSARNSV